MDYSVWINIVKSKYFLKVCNKFYGKGRNKSIKVFCPKENIFSKIISSHNNFVAH